MLVLSRPVKILFGSGGLLVLLWLFLLRFSASSLREISTPHTPHNQASTMDITESAKEIFFFDHEIPSSVIHEADNLTCESAQINILGVNTYMMSAKPTERKSNLTFLFLHGAAFSSANWEKTLQLMASLGFYSIAIDLPGFGRTKDELSSGKGAFNNKVDYMTRLTESFNLKRIIMVMPSMSGKFGLPFLLSHPEFFAGFVPVAPVGTGAVPQSRLKSLEVPTLLVYGENDKSLGKISHRDLRVIPHFQAVVLKNAGHAAYIDQPEMFHKLLYNFALKLA